MSSYYVQYVLNLKDRVSGQLGNVQAKVANFDKAIGGLGGTIAGALAVGSVLEFTQVAINAAMEAEAVDARLTNAAKNLTNANYEQAQSLVVLASKLQAKSRFGDEDIKSQMTALIQYGMTRDEVEKFMPVIADFAAATGQSLGDATQAVISGSNGMTRGLKKYGLELNLTGERAADSAQIIEELNRKFGGGAQQDLDTTAGKVAQLKEQYGDFQEAVGAKLFDSLNQLGLVFKTLSGDMGAFGQIMDNISNMSFTDFLAKGNPLVALTREAGYAFGWWNKEITETDRVIESTTTKAKMFEQAIAAGGDQMEMAYQRVAQVFSITRQEFEKYVKVYSKNTGATAVPGVQSISDIEEQINKLKTLQKEATSAQEFKSKQTEIDRLQKQVDKITGKPTGGGARAGGAGAGATSSTLTSRSPQTFNINITKLVETINTTKPQLNTTDSQTMRQITEALVTAVNDVQTTIQ